MGGLNLKPEWDNLGKQMDEKVTIAEVKKWFHKTRTDRGWKPTSKSLAISLCLESAELLEHFQWDENVKKGEREEIELEVGDILNYLCEFSDKLGIDLATVAQKTIKKIDKKYPTDKVLKHGSEFYYQQKKKYRKNK